VALEIDDDALVALYRQEADGLVGLLYAYCGDRAVAEELAHDAFLKLRGSLHRIDDPARTPAYLRSIALNLARSSFRRRAVAERWRRRQAPPADHQSAEHDVVLRDDQRAVITALQRLSDRQRACLVLRYYEDRTEREIADVLGLSPNSVKVYVRRGMAALASMLEAHG
jgi:RNA polymerase sigma factor (sigma-70 family)